MEIFGVGPLEFLLILVIALVILGPEDMVGTARKIGQWIYRVVRSPTWRAIIESTNDLRNLPQQIVRDAGLQDAVNEVKQTASEVKAQMSDTTREISGEMAAATRDINGEMRAATGDVAKELGAATATAAATATMSNEEIRAATLKKALAEAETGTVSEPPILWPESNAAGTSTGVENATPADGANAPEDAGPAGAEPVPFSLTSQGETPAPLGEVEATAPQDGAAAPSAATEATAAASVNPYVAGLDTFAQALGQPTDHHSAEPGENAAPSAPVGSSPPQMAFSAALGITPEMLKASPDVSKEASTPQGGAEASTPQGGAEASTPQEGNAAPVQPWASGVTTFTAAPGSPPDGDDFETRMQNRMAEMLKSFEKLEQASSAAAPSEASSEPPAENIDI